MHGAPALTPPSPGPRIRRGGSGVRGVAGVKRRRAGRSEDAPNRIPLPSFSTQPQEIQSDSEDDSDHELQLARVVYLDGLQALHDRLQVVWTNPIYRIGAIKKTELKRKGRK